MGYSKIVSDEPFISGENKIDDFESRPINIPELRFNLGLQKRLNNFSYLDTRVYISYTYEKTSYYSTMTYLIPSVYEVEEVHPKIMSHFVFGLDFKIGLAWGWK